MILPGLADEALVVEPLHLLADDQLGQFPAAGAAQRDQRADFVDVGFLDLVAVGREHAEHRLFGGQFRRHAEDLQVH